MFKNVASQKVIFFAFDSTTNLPKTGDAANITPYVSKDYGSVTAITDTSATEMDSTNAKGYYLVDLTQSETNADTLLFSAKSSTANIVVVGAPAIVFTSAATPAVDILSISGDTTAADNAEAFFDGTGYAGTNNVIPTVTTLTQLSAAATEAYATDGNAATPIQLLYMIWSMLAEKSISGTTLTTKKLDGSTTSMTFTLNSSTTPTSVTRAT